MHMESMKASQFMDKIGYAFLNSIMIAAMPVFALSAILQSL